MVDESVQTLHDCIPDTPESARADAVPAATSADLHSIDNIASQLVTYYYYYYLFIYYATKAAQ